MSERYSVRTVSGCVLLTAGLLLCFFPSFPIQEHDRLSYRTKSYHDEVLTDIPTERNGPVSVNTADADELQSLPGVGETISALLIDERSKNGPFHYPEDLESVRGIGPWTLEKLRGMIDLTSNESGD